MSIYYTAPVTKSKSECYMESYLDEVFLESNDEISSIKDRINEAEFSTAQEATEFFAETSNIINCSNLSEPMKKALLERTMDKIVLEFQGDPEKNKEFIDLLKEMENALEAAEKDIRKMDEIIRRLGKNIKELYNETAKKGFGQPNMLNKLKTITDHVKKEVEDYRSFTKDNYKDVNIRKTYDNLKKKAKSFNNKYSQLTMEEKKKFVAKFQKSIQDMREIIKPWAKNGKDGDDILKQIKTLENIDSILGKKLYKDMLDIMDLIVQVYNIHLSNCMVIFQTLKIEKEKGFMYKMVNRILK